MWTDTTCGAQACFSTLAVESWDGNGYQAWIAGDPTMAGAEYAFQEVLPDGSGEEILVHGGVIYSPDAGPQRAWTETYASLNGAPYTLVGQKYDKSACLYHAIQDADALLGSWATGGFDPAIAAYQAALNDPTLTACWTVKDEVPLLKDFARFRLVVSHVAGGQSGKAAAVAAQIEQPALKGAADAFLEELQGIGQRHPGVSRYGRLRGGQSGRVAVPGRLGAGKPDVCAGRPLSAKIDAIGVLNGPKQIFRKGVFQ